jgi:putative ABC transport system permease protein
MVGTMLGVAVLFGVLITNAGISRALDRVTEWSTNTVVLEAPGTYGSEVSEEALVRAAALPDVVATYGNVWFRGRSSAPAAEGEDVYVNASEQVEGSAFAERDREPRGLQPSKVTGTDPKPGANEVAIGDHWAERLGVGLGDTFTLETPTGPAQLTVVKRFEGVPGSLQTSIDTARRLAGTTPGGFGNITVELLDGVDPAGWVRANEVALGADVRPSTGGDIDVSAIEVLQNAFFSVGLLAIFVGGFLMYLTMTMSVAERNRTWGVLRAVGAPRRAVLRTVLVESLVLGALSTVVGLVLGFLIGAGLLRLTTAMYGVTSARVAPTAGAVLTAILLGILVPPLAALRPAWHAASAEPVEAMRDLHRDESSIGRGWMFGLPMLLLGFALALRPGRSGVDLAVLLVLFGSVLLVPPLLTPVVRVVSRVTSLLAPGLGAAAVGHLVKERRRSSYTLALVMIVLAMILAMGSLQTSLLRALDDAARIRYGTDVSIYSNTPLPAEVRQRLASLPNVDGATETSYGRLRITSPSPVDGNVLVIEPTSFFALQGLPWVEGDDERAAVALGAGDAILIPQVVAQQMGLGVGDALTVETTSGPHDLRVAGVFATPQRGVEAIVGFVDGRRWFGATEPTGIGLRATDGTSADALRDSVEAALGNTSAYFVSTTPEEVARGVEQIRQTFRPFAAVVFVAGIVGALGLANTLLMGLIRRTREIGVLRAIGMSRRDLGAMVVVESLTMALVAFVLASGLGWLLAYAMLKTSGRALGFVVDFVPPFGLLPSTLLATLVLGAVATLAPIRRLARLDPVVALRFE